MNELFTLALKPWFKSTGIKLFQAACLSDSNFKSLEIDQVLLSIIDARTSNCFQFQLKIA